MKRRAESRMVFPSLCKLLENKSLSVTDILTAGIEELHLKHFPAVKTYDRHGNLVLTWAFQDNFWTIINENQSSDCDENTRQMFSDLVKGDLEKRGLIYVSKLKKTPKILPWIGICLRRLKREKLALDLTVTTLTYISCIAFMMQGWYVDFDRLVILVHESSIDQSKLKALEILSKLELAKFHFRQLKLYRLHFSIPHKLPELEAKPDSVIKEADVRDRETSKPDDKEVEGTSRKIGDDDECLIFDRNVDSRRQSTCQPVKKITNTIWSGRELEILHNVSEINETCLQKMYDSFKLKCIQSKIPFRTFRAFESKLRRL